MSPRYALNRRQFLRTGGMIASTALAAACAAPNLLVTPTPVYQMPRRPLGRTGEQLSIVGFGGIVVDQETQESANQLVARAMERGINYFDVAPQYGMAETRLGPALEPYRQSVFLACKTLMRDRERATAELHRSLERLRTDYFDLYQFHAVTSMQDVETILGPGGALEAFLEARDQGLIRYIGFSAHSEQAALALLDGFAFDTILYPVNWVCWYQGNFGPAVLAKAQEKGVGILALKALAKQQQLPGRPKEWPKCWYEPVDGPQEAELGLRFALSRPVTAAVSPSHAELLWWACDAVEHVAPLSQQEEAELVERSRELVPLFTA
jgi:predicted aldo/keto reductase-like oxidoreductase